MTAPSVSFDTIPSSDYDPESPITTGLMGSIINRTQHNYEWLGYGYTPAQAHDHDGINSALLPGNVFGNLYAFDNYT